MACFTKELLVACVVLLLGTSIKAISVIGQDVDVVAGEDAQLFCELFKTEEPLTNICWQRRTKEKPTNTDFFAITLDGKEKYTDELRDRITFTGNISGLNGAILLRNVAASDEGIYTCIFSVSSSGPYEKKIYLSVLVPPDVSVSTDVPPVAGDTEEILATCIAANAKPAAEVTWSLGALSDSVKVQTNTTVDSDGRYTVKSSLIGVASKDLNQQKVQCLIPHPGLKEKLELDHTLIIHYPPQVVYISAGDQDKKQTFQCKADAYPEPTNFIWSRHFPVNEPLSSGVNGSNLTPAYNGLYYCVAANKYGKAVGSVYVNFSPSRESITCWSLFILAIFAGLVGFLIWKFNLHQHVRERLGCCRHESVPSNSIVFDSPSNMVLKISS